MKQQCFSVADARTGYFNVPFFSPTVASGTRMFQEVLADPTTLCARYPDDFELWHVGEFDDTDGRFTEPFAPKLLVKARALLVSQEKGVE